MLCTPRLLNLCAAFRCRSGFLESRQYRCDPPPGTGGGGGGGGGGGARLLAALNVEISVHERLPLNQVDPVLA